MKLMMKDQFSFQKAMGYGDDPEQMTAEETSSHIFGWCKELEKLNESGNGSDELAQLESFLGELAKGDIEYTEPLKRYEFSVVFNRFTNIEVFGKDEEEAISNARKMFHKNRDELQAISEYGDTVIYKLRRD